MKTTLISGLASAILVTAGGMWNAVPAQAQSLPEVCRGQDGGGFKVGFANLAESSDFAVIVREGIQRVAEACNLTLVVADNDRDPARRSTTFTTSWLRKSMELSSSTVWVISERRSAR